MHSALADLWELTRTAGPFSTALLFYLYMDERKERRRLGLQLTEVLERSVRVIGEVRATLETWLTVFARGRR